MIYKTFDEWSAQGYRILKGSKGAKSDKGTIVFSEEQVWEPSDNYPYGQQEDYDYDENHFYGDLWSLF